MSAELLRKAATILRDPNRCNRPNYEDALADWLTENAHRCDQLWIEPMPQAVTLARLIVGEQP